MTPPFIWFLFGFLFGSTFDLLGFSLTNRKVDLAPTLVLTLVPIMTNIKVDLVPRLAPPLLRDPSGSLRKRWIYEILRVGISLDTI